MKTISLHGISKQFKDITAVDNVDLTINEGETFSLLGLNGAGKSTLIKMLTGLIRPTSGEGKVFDYDLINDIQQIKQISGLSPQENALGNNLTVKENMEMMSHLYGLDEQIAKENVKSLMNALDLTKFASKKAKTLSGGYKRRLSIAMALVSNPKILYLDEPTLGLDVLNRRELWKIIESLKGKVTIILTTHYMEESQHLADRIGIIKDGKIYKVDTLENILKETNTSSLEDAFVKIVEGE